MEITCLGLLVIRGILYLELASPDSCQCDRSLWCRSSEGWLAACPAPRGSKRLEGATGATEAILSLLMLVHGLLPYGEL